MDRVGLKKGEGGGVGLRGVGNVSSRKFSNVSDHLTLGMLSKLLAACSSFF